MDKKMEDLNAEAEDLERRGTTFTRRDGTSVRGRRIQVDPSEFDGQLVEFAVHKSGRADTN